MLAKTNIIYLLAFLYLSIDSYGQWFRYPHPNGFHANNNSISSELKITNDTLRTLSSVYLGTLGNAHARHQLNCYDNQGNYLNHFQVPALVNPTNFNESSSHFLGDSLVLISRNYDRNNSDTSSIELFNVSGNRKWVYKDSALAITSLYGWSKDYFFFLNQLGYSVHHTSDGSLHHYISYSAMLDTIGRVMGFGKPAYSIGRVMQAIKTDSTFLLMNRVQKDSGNNHNHFIFLKLDHSLRVKNFNIVNNGRVWYHYNDNRYTYLYTDTAVYRNGSWCRPVHTYDIYGLEIDTTFIQIKDAQSAHEAVDNIFIDYFNRVDDTIAIVIHRSIYTDSTYQHLLVKYLDLQNDTTLHTVKLVGYRGSGFAHNDLISADVDTNTLDTYLTFRIGMNLPSGIAKVSIYKSNPISLFEWSNLGSEIQVYPNPSSDYLRISGDLTNNLKYSIHQLDGRMIKQGLLSINQSKIGIQDLPKGNYLIRIGSHTKRFIRK